MTRHRRPPIALIVAMVALGAWGCSDGGVGSACQSQGECAGGLGCAGPDDPPVCGIPARRTCTADTCLADERCHAIVDACSANGIGSECGSPCSDERGCGEAFRCDEEGTCVPRSCTDGFACAAHEVCDPDAVSASAPIYERGHDCQVRACSDDGACADLGLVCVNGRCQTSEGTCVEVVIVP